MPTAPLPPGLHLVFGGASSGKSRYAEQRIEASAPRRFYIATAVPGEAELDAKIAAHRARRASGWQTVEYGCSADLPKRDDLHNSAILFDCATLWLGLQVDGDWRAAAQQLLADLCACAVPVAVVSNELGMGLVPQTAEARTFRDAHGAMNQMIAEAAQSVTFIAAGQPLVLKDTP